MEVRQRKLKDDTATSTPHINARSRGIKQPRRLKKVFFLLLLLALFVTYFLGLFAGQSQWLDGIAKSLGYESVHHYAVIIDAGSSGSRVLAYKFRVPFTVFGQANLDLVEEYFEQSKPGLSSFADEPSKGADTIVQLIKKAEFLIPADKRKVTPLIVRATAGLRLLPSDKAQQLLVAVQQAIATLGYDVGNHSVEIMDGSDEGIFIWYTLNLLHNLMDGETMAALDLGGGSTQITYQLADSDRAEYPATDQYVVPAGANNISLYTHSYLNLGLLAARYGIFTEERGQGAPADGTEFSSVCVDPIVQKEKWTYANKQYIVSGASRQGLKKDAVYNRCHALVARYVRRTLDWEPQQPPRGSVAAMSYFYDVAADAGMIDVMKGGTVSVAQYRANALKACSGSNVEQPWACVDLVYVVTLLQDAYKIRDLEPVSYNVEQPWACVDLVYVVTLLQDAYKIRDLEPVSLFKKVNGHEVSWALGLAYTTVMNKLAAAAAAQAA